MIYPKPYSIYLSGTVGLQAADGHTEGDRPLNLRHHVLLSYKDTPHAPHCARLKEKEYIYIYIYIYMGNG